jgi:outer membrane protein TolC
MYKKMFIFGLLLATLFSPLFAKQSLSLEQALQLAKANNLGLASNAIDVAAAKRDVDTSWNLFVPKIEIALSNFGSKPVFKAFPFTGAYNSGLGVNLSVTLTLNPAVKDQMDSYNLGYQIQQVTYAQAQAEVERNVTKLYYYLLMEAENIGDGGALQPVELRAAQDTHPASQEPVPVKSPEPESLARLGLV